ncbi:hypothetical protein Bca52824_008791 [Brassica carinata]|uniref:Uncharacterized protein n=1 Tax=Brassica carinata TaxID=52824 RepID=A0A8X8B994_BRACI|nr:hypothetical protein Bca52824_008791 [Brassica carinata]
MSPTCNGSEALIDDTSDNDDYDQTLAAWILGVKSSNGSDKSNGELFHFVGESEKSATSTPKSTLEGFKECFAELEKYGFDVTTPISRINMLLFLIEKQVSTEKRLKSNAKNMKKEVNQLQKHKEDLKAVECKILELQSQRAVLKQKKKDASEMQLCAEDLDKEIHYVGFGTTVSASCSVLQMRGRLDVS